MNTASPDSGSDRPSATRLFLFWLSLIVFVPVLVLGLVLAASIAGRNGNVVTLRDNGGKIEVLGAAIGTNQLSLEHSWQRVARKILPARFQKWIPVSFAATAPVYQSYSNAVNVWLRFPKRSPNEAADIVPKADYYHVVLDYGGIYYPAGPGLFAVTRFGGPSDAYSPLSFPVFPRRGKQAVIRILDTNDTIAATLHVRPPTSPAFPVWHPQPLPQSATNANGIVLTLQRLEWRGQGTQRYVAGVWQPGPVAPYWSNAIVGKITFFDATGNEGTNLLPDEPAWKIRAELLRTNAADYAPDERLVLTNLVPAVPGQSIVLNQTANIAGARFKVGTFHSSRLPATAAVVNQFSKPSTAPRGRSQDLDWLQWRDYLPYVDVEVSGAGIVSLIHFRAMNSEGREVSVQYLNPTYGTGGWTANYYLYFEAQPSDVLTVQMFVSRPLVFDFLVDPRDVKSEPQGNSP